MEVELLEFHSPVYGTGVSGDFRSVPLARLAFRISCRLFRVPCFVLYFTAMFATALLLILGAMVFVFSRPAYAVCPVCTIAAGSALAIAEVLGVDDLVAALLIGALVTSSAIWLAGKIKNFPKIISELAMTVVFYLMTLGALQLQGKLGRPNCRYWGIDKVVFGLTLGSIVFWLGVLLDRFLRGKHNGKGFFPFQKVVLPLLPVAILGLLFSFCWL